MDIIFNYLRDGIIGNAGTIALTNVVQTGLLFIGLSLMANDITKIFLGIGVILGASSVEKVGGRYGLSANANYSTKQIKKTVSISFTTK